MAYCENSRRRGDDNEIFVVVETKRLVFRIQHEIDRGDREEGEKTFATSFSIMKASRIGMATAVILPAI
jgi:hypothetical protein